MYNIICITAWRARWSGILNIVGIWALFSRTCSRGWSFTNTLYSHNSHLEFFNYR